MKHNDVTMEDIRNFMDERGDYWGIKDKFDCDSFTNAEKIYLVHILTKNSLQIILIQT